MTGNAIGDYVNDRVAVRIRRIILKSRPALRGNPGLHTDAIN